MRYFVCVLFYLTSAIALSGEADPVHLPTLTFEQITKAGEQDEVKEFTREKSYNLALFDGGGSGQFPPRGWTETRETVQIEIDGKKTDVSLLHWLPNEETKLRSPVREIQLWVSDASKVPSFNVPLPGPDITVPPNVVKLHFLPTEVAAPGGRQQKSEIKGELNGETEVSVSGKSYRCKKFACSLAGTEEGVIDYILSDDIPGKGYSFKLAGSSRGKSFTYEVRLKSIKANP